MPRNPYIRSTEFPYHITARCHGKKHFPLELNDVWELFQEELFLSHVLFGLEIHSFVLMPNHFHLLARDPEGSLSESMHRLMLSVTKRINLQARREGALWSARFYRCLIQSPHYYLNAYKYVYHNPVKGGLVSRAEAWRYSTLHGSLGFGKILIPTIEDVNLFGDVDGTLRWLNQTPKQTHWTDVRNALRRQEFTLTKRSRESGKSHPLDHSRL